MVNTKALASVLAFAFVSLPLAGSANARPRPEVKKEFEANKSFGLGVMLGSLNGLSGKLYLGADTALDFGIGSHDDFYDDGSLQVHADFLWHPVVLASPDSFELPLYLGVGFRYLDHDFSNDFNNDRFDDHEHLGVRAPLGMMLDFNRVPIDVFFELSLVVDLVTFDDDDEFDHRRTDLDGSVGMRYYF